MSLCSPEDRPTVKAAAFEFLQLCQRHGLEPQSILQAGIAVMAAVIQQEANGDQKYVMELVDRFERSLRSAIQVDPEVDEGVDDGSAS